MNKKVYISSLLLGCALAISSCPLFSMKARLAKILKRSVRSVARVQTQSDIQKLCTVFEAKNIEEQQADLGDFLSMITTKLSEITDAENKKIQAAISLDVIAHYFTDASSDIGEDKKKYDAFTKDLMTVAEEFEKVGFDSLVADKLDIHLTMLQAAFVIHEELEEAKQNIADNKELEKQLTIKNKELEAVKKETERTIEAAAEVCGSAATVNQQTQLAIKAAEEKTQALRQIADSCVEKTKTIKGSLLDQEALI